MPEATVACEPLQRRALFEVIADHLRERILGHELAAGMPLDEFELASYYGVSRTPVREAIKVLAHEGLLDCPLRRGVSVRAVDPALHDEARALHEVLHAHARHTRDIAPQQGALLPVLMELVEQRLRHTRSRAAGIGTAHREQARQPA